MTLYIRIITSLVAIFSIVTINTSISIHASNKQIKGNGFPSPPSTGCNVGQKNPLSYMAVAASLTRKPQTVERVVDIGLDRQSFIDRGWTEDMLGSYENGSKVKKRGIFLSMYYALQIGQPEDNKNPWHEAIGDFHRGLGAHIDYYLWEQHKKHFRLYAYDNLNAPTRRGSIVGRKSTEAPFFDGGDCSGTNVVGCAGADDKIYIRTDYNWIFGKRLDAPVRIEENGRYYVNITYTITHEVGHFFGMNHTSSPDSIMYPVLGTNSNQSWHDSSLQQQNVFRELSHKLNNPDGFANR